MNANIYKYIGYIVIISSITLFIIVSNNNKRNQYETFLLNEFNVISNYSEKQLNNIPQPAQPHLATFQNYFMTIDPYLGYIPKERLYDAFNEMKNLKNVSMGRDINWQNINSNMGGRTRALMYDPNDTTFKKVWAGSVTGGLWYNNDIEDTNSIWFPVDDFWNNLSISKIVFDPANPNIFYVGTGEANTAITTYRESSSKGYGIWKSIDGGENWELIESTQNFDYITDIEIRLTENTSEIYIGVVSGIYQGENHESLPTDGVYKSINGGLTWQQILPNITSSNTPYSPSDIEITSSGKILVGTMKNLNGEGGACILTSDLGDYGTWSINEEFQNIIENNNEYNVPGRVVLSSSSSAPNFIYGVIGSGYINNMGFNLSYGNYIIKSNNEGLSWEEINIPYDIGSDWATLAWHALKVAVHPDYPNIVFIGGLELYKSSDGGSTWNDISDWSLMYEGGGNRYVHADIHEILFKPNNPNSIIVSSDGGVFLSNNAMNENWEDIMFIERNQGYNTLQFYTSDIGPIEFENVFVGGLQDNGTLITGLMDNDNNEFDLNDMISGGDGAYCFFDNNDPILITSTYYNYYYLYNYEQNTYSYISNNSGVFINPADYHNETNTLYANKVKFNGSQSNRIIKIENINPNLFTGSNDDFDISTIILNTNSSAYFSAIKISPYSNNSTTIFLGNQSGELFKVENINNSPATYDIGSSSFPTANVSSIDIGSSENEILITFSNYGVSSIWMTLDGGDNWEEKEGNLPDMPIRWGLLHPDDSNNALIATEIGVWKSTNLLDDNVLWLPSSNGLANVRVDMLSLRETDNMVLAATHGRGLFYAVYNLPMEGDLNSDGEINVVDIVTLVNLIIENSTFTMDADINDDLQLNILDVVLLVNMILNS